MLAATIGCSAFSTAVRSFVIDVLETPREAGERARVLLDGMPAEIFDVVVVRVDAVKRRASGVNFVKVGEIVVDEMMKWLGRTHHLGSSSNPCSVIANSDKPQWYNYPNPRMAGSLYVVSTPIGNLDDITVRALNTLKSVGLVAAEDTRRTGLLLRHFGIATPTTSLHEHNEARNCRRFCESFPTASTSRSSPTPALRSSPTPASG